MVKCILCGIEIKVLTYMSHQGGYAHQICIMHELVCSENCKKNSLEDLDNNNKERSEINMSNKIEKEWLEFFMTDEKPRTNVWEVFNKKTNDYLGNVMWFSSFRQYCFFPEKDIVLAAACLEQLARFIRNEMLKRKKSK